MQASQLSVNQDLMSSLRSNVLVWYSLTRMSEGTKIQMLAFTAHPLCLHTLHSLCIHSLHSLCLHSLHSFFAFTVHSLFAFTVHSLFAFTVPSFFAFTVHSLFAFTAHSLFAFTVHSLCIYCAFTEHSICIPFAFTVHSLAHLMCSGRLLHVLLSRHWCISCEVVEAALAVCEGSGVARLCMECAVGAVHVRDVCNLCVIGQGGELG